MPIIGRRTGPCRGQGEAARRLDKVGIGRADGSQEVAGLCDGAARDGHGAAHERQAEIDGVVDGGAGRGVEHGAADVGGQAAGGHAAARDGLDELLFRALRVADAAAAGRCRPQHGGNGGDGLGLVLLDADGGALRLQDLQDDAQAADDALRAFRASGGRRT